MYPTALMLVLWWTTVTVYVVTASLRLWLHWKLPKNFVVIKVQDIFLGITTMLLLALVISTTYFLHVLDQHTGVSSVTMMNPSLEGGLTRQTLDAIKLLNHASYAIYVVSTVLLWFSKAMLASIYWQLCPQLKKGSKIMVWATVVWIMATFITIMGLNIFSCGNPTNIWRVFPDETKPACDIATKLSVYAPYTVMSASTDILLMITGFLILRDLRVERYRSKITAIALVTFIGVVSLSAGFVRCCITAHFVGSVHAVNPAQTRALIFWNGLEDLTAALACVLPPLRLLARNFAEGRSNGGLESAPLARGPEEPEKRSNSELEAPS